VAIAIDRLLYVHRFAFHCFIGRIFQAGTISAASSLKVSSWIRDWQIRVVNENRVRDTTTQGPLERIRGEI